MNLDGKKILVTGADGFIGSHLTEMLVKRGHQVRALVMYNSFNSWGWLDDSVYSDQIEVVAGDVRDPFFCQQLTKDIDVIFHLAALIAIPFSYTAPQSYIETNVNGTLNLCQAALSNNVKRFVLTSTSEVYGTARYVPIDEKHPLQPQSPYSASKIAGDMLALSFFNSFNLPLVIARPFNTFGPRQSARAVIPSIIIQIANGVQELKLGDVSPTRDFNYVSDTCEGFIQLATCDDALGKVINIGSNFEVTVKETVMRIASVMNSKITIIEDQQRIRPENSEVFRLWCDNSEINRLTGFKPQHSFDDGLRKTIEWFRVPENLSKYKSGIYNV